MPGETAQKMIARSLARHPRKDGRAWMLVSVTSNADSDALTQGTATITETPIYPVVDAINEYEAMNIGANVRAGDLRLRLPGTLDLTTLTVLKCDGETVDIIRNPEMFRDGHIEYYKLYVRRRSEATRDS